MLVRFNFDKTVVLFNQDLGILSGFRKILSVYEMSSENLSWNWWKRFFFILAEFEEAEVDSRYAESVQNLVELVYFMEHDWGQMPETLRRDFK